MTNNVVRMFPKKEEKETKKVSLTDGYTRIADLLIEKLAMADLNGREFRILMCVIRKTYGFNKSEDWIALSQFVEMTGVSKSNCSSLLSGLEKKRILNVRKIGNDRNLSINTKIEEWVSNKRVLKNENKQARNENKPPEIKNKSPKNDNHNRDINKNTNTKPSLSELSSEREEDDVSVSLPIEKPNAVIHTQNGKKWGTAVDLSIAETMAQMISNVTGDEKQPNICDWANTIRLLRERDGRTPEQIGALFSWANQDSFWQTNILSPGKLRQQWSALAAKRNQERNRENHHGRRQNPNSASAANHRVALSEAIFDAPGCESLSEDEQAEIFGQ